jgi:hypothetical protein
MDLQRLTIASAIAFKSDLSAATADAIVSAAFALLVASAILLTVREPEELGRTAPCPTWGRVDWLDSTEVEPGWEF